MEVLPENDEIRPAHDLRPLCRSPVGCLNSEDPLTLNDINTIDATNRLWDINVNSNSQPKFKRMLKYMYIVL